MDKQKKCLKQGSVRVSKIRMLVQELNRDGLAGVRVGVPVRRHVCHEDGVWWKRSPHYSPDRLLCFIINNVHVHVHVCLTSSRPWLSPWQRSVWVCAIPPQSLPSMQRLTTCFEKPACISKGKAAQKGNEAPAVDFYTEERECKVLYSKSQVSTSSSVNTFTRSSNSNFGSQSIIEIYKNEWLCASSQAA